MAYEKIGLLHAIGRIACRPHPAARQLVTTYRQDAHSLPAGIFLLAGRFFPAVATRCTDQGEIWQGGAADL